MHNDSGANGTEGCQPWGVQGLDHVHLIDDVLDFIGLERADEVEIRTIHGFCYQLLREENRRRGERYSEPVVWDEVDCEELLQSILSSQYALWECGATFLPLSDEDNEGIEGKQFEIFTKKGRLRNFVSALKHIREEQGFYGEGEFVDYQKAFDFLQK